MNSFDFDVVTGPSLQKRPACAVDASPRREENGREGQSDGKRTGRPRDGIASKPASR